MVKNLPANAGAAGAVGSIPGLERAPTGGNGIPFQHSCLKNSVDRGTWCMKIVLFEPYFKKRF